jgi:hypothetical protein
LKIKELFILYKKNISIKNRPQNGLEGGRILHKFVIQYFLVYYYKNICILFLFFPSIIYRPTLKITYPAAVIEWGHDFREARIRLKVPSAASIERFNLLAYKDPYLFELLGNW